MKIGAVPPPNPHSGRCTMRYKFTSRENKEIFIELVDYSGELLDPRFSTTDLAASLQTYLSAVDGFLFIAEHAKAGETAGELAGYLHRLSQALAIQRQLARKPANLPSVPVALAVNKWDRRGALSKGDNAHEQETENLTSFLRESDPRPPHAILLDELEAASSGKCAAFPVSAFGESVLEPAGIEGGFVEKPAQVVPQLPSFGLEEPFLWLVEQCDIADAEKLESASRSAVTRWNPIVTLGQVRAACQRTKRMPRASESTRKIKVARRRLLRRFAAQVGAFIALLMVLELAVDNIAYRRAQSEMADAGDPNGWRKAEAWFSDYANSFQWRHSLHKFLVLSPSDAAITIGEARTKREESAWETVKIAIEAPVQKKLAQVFLAQYPQSLHAPETKKLIEDIELAEKRAELEKLFIALENGLGTIKQLKAFEDGKSLPTRNYRGVLERLDRFAIDLEKWRPEGATDEQIGRYQSMAREVGLLQKDVVGLLAAGDARVEYHKLAELGKWEDAAKVLLGLHGEFSDLRAHYREKALPQIVAAAIKKCGNGAGWKAALEELKPFQKEPIRSLLPDSAMTELFECGGRINEAGDRWLYAQCNRLRGAESFERYKRDAPLKTMQNTAEEWIEFFRLRQTPRSARVGIARIDWSHNAKDADTLWDGENYLYTDFGGKQVKAQFFSNRKDPWQPADEVHKAAVDGIVLSKPQRIIVNVYDVDGLWLDDWDFLGGGEVTKLLEEVDGHILQLTGGDYPGSKVTFSAEIQDDKGNWKTFKVPPLPEWSSKR